MRLLEKNPRDRLGATSAEEIRSHPWFEKVNWNALLNRSIKAPFVPILTSDADISNFDEEFTSCSVESFSEKEEGEAEADSFAGFEYEQK
jgi:serum/glucocorticoid-regulated kinase 2